MTKRRSIFGTATKNVGITTADRTKPRLPAGNTYAQRAWASRSGGECSRMDNDQLTLPLPGLGRDWRKDASLRPQPKRDGPDDWTTPACLCRAAVYVLRTLLCPCPVIWEPAPGDGVLAKAMQEGGFKVQVTFEDFKTCPVPNDARIMVTNPPFNQMGMFLERGLQLLDAGELDAMITLFRHDHLNAECREPPHCRIAALGRATRLYHCHWRPFWRDEKTSSPRWTFTWAKWEPAARPDRPIWLEPEDVA
jgi:hypothetical protein